MDFLALQTEVMRRIEETGTPSHWSTQEVKDAINAGYMDFCDDTECYEREDKFAVDGSLYYDLEAEYKYQEPFLGLRRILNITTGKWLEMVTARELDEEYYPQWQLLTGEPQFVVMRSATQMGLVPVKTPAGLGDELLVRRTALPLPLVHDTDEPMFNREFHMYLADYAAEDLLADDGEVDKAMMFRQAYLLGRMKMRAQKSAGNAVQGGSRTLVVGG
jgi:hypothetical protein